MIDDIKGTTPEEMKEYECPFLAQWDNNFCITNRCVMWKEIKDSKGVCLQRVKKER